MKKNIILNIDSYKASHYLQYPPNAEFINSYIESRGGIFDQVMFFGIQAFIKEYLLNPITIDDINEAEEVILSHGLYFNRKGWEYILEKHNGYLPLQVEAIPEGTVIETKNCLVQVINTDPKCYWLTSYIETALLRAVWYPTTVSTISYQIKKVLKKYMEISSNNLSGLLYKLHDFGARGASSYETSVLAGMSHLINFKGSDTVACLQYIRKYYNLYEMPGFSIPAAEHSTITSWGINNEEDAYKNMLDKFAKKDKAVSIVCDSYDLFRAIELYIGNSLKDQIINSGAIIIIRPDSGNPVEVVIKTINKLMDLFGSTINNKGYKILPDCIKVIQGDGVNYESIINICEAMINNQLSIDNVSFGMGAELHQKVNRDTFKFAMKSSSITINNKEYDVFKNPVTDPSKSSKKGVLKVIKNNNIFKTIKNSEPGKNELRIIYLNGRLIIDEDWNTIFNRADSIHY